MIANISKGLGVFFKFISLVLIVTVQRPQGDSRVAFFFKFFPNVLVCVGFLENLSK